jgi:DNA-binding CsgD family transcriptional regulator
MEVIAQTHIFESGLIVEEEKAFCMESQVALLWDSSSLSDLPSDISNGDISFMFFLSAIVIIAWQFYQQPHWSITHFAKNLAAATHDYLRLVVHRDVALPASSIPIIEGRQGARVQWQHVVYGSLHVPLTPYSESVPALSPSQIERLASICGWMLHQLDQPIVSRRVPSFYSEQIQFVHNLPPQALQVLQFMSQGYSTKEIGHLLNIKERTVEKYRETIYAHLQVHSAEEAMAIARVSGILDK